MSVLAPPPAAAVMLTRGFAVEGNEVDVWDFFERGKGRRDGADAPAGDDVPPDHPSS
jgi:hypothetical protein